NVIYDAAGLCLDSSGEAPCSAQFCKECCSAVRKGKTPPLALANHNYVGAVPSVLQGLTIAEEMMISKCRAKCFILHLREEAVNIPNAQRGLKGNIIIFPQRTSSILDILPPALEDVVTPICVLFVGSCPPTQEWLRKNARPLIVRREKIRSALMWLQEHNDLYRDVNIDSQRLASLSEEDVLP
ncbi:hypothetical protein DEU56DRAFT_701740, partial [Suillus clintonianus]|uniref:uncharacterized protein n=1 Tax=Suillus clintonianus TaxID=1904413 RepID=UPI001B8688FB